MEDVVTVNKLDFSEVKKDIDLTTAHNLSEKCLNCKNPRCVTGCPLGINIPEFISLIKENKYEEAYEKISEKSVMPEVCGRVCPQEKTCQAKCIRGLNGESVRIGDLERFASNYQKENFNISENGKKVAVIGSGPASLSCAYHLRKSGFKVTVFEASHKFGGVLTYGIPNFRLPKDIVDNVILKLERMGVIFKNDTLVGKTITIKELKKDFDYIFIGTGAGIPKTLDIEGIMAKNVMSANELLTRINLMNAPFSDTPLNVPRKAIIIGGGNVACDAARCLVRLGAYVTICYRKDENNLKMRQEEYKHALKEGVEFAHARGKKVYVTLNIIPHDSDLNGIESYIRELYELNVDAVLVSDPGMMTIVKNTVPEHSFPLIHGSSKKCKSANEIFICASLLHLPTLPF